MGYEEKISGGFGEKADMPQMRFMEITRDTPDCIVVQLAGHDRVHTHGAGSPEELRKWRLGGPIFNRTCYAMVEEGDRVHAAIYVQKAYRNVESDRDLHGNVRKILERSVRERNERPTHLVFYSISNLSDKKGVGQNLVVSLHEHLNREYTGALMTTLSPMRSFDKNMSAEECAAFMALPDVNKRRAVIAHLLAGTDLVQQFHMGNGARIGDIKFMAGDISGEGENARQHIVMGNYVYDNDPAVLKENAAQFAEVKRALRDANMDESVRREIVSEIIYSKISPTLLNDAQIERSITRCREVQNAPAEMKLRA